MPTIQPHQLASHLRKIIAEAAQELGVRETARRAGIGPMIVSRLIHGHEGVRLDHVCLVAAAVGYSLELKRRN